MGMRWIGVTTWTAELGTKARRLTRVWNQPEGAGTVPLFAHPQSRLAATLQVEFPD
jgi:hypothetical protein